MGFLPLAALRSRHASGGGIDGANATPQAALAGLLT